MPEHVHRFRISGPSRSDEQRQDALQINLRAIGREHQCSKIELRPTMRPCRREPVPMHREFRIGPHAPSALMAAAEHVPGIGVALTRGVIEPAEGGLRIAHDAVAIEQHVPPAELRFGQSRKCLFTDELRAEFRVRGEPFGVPLGTEPNQNRAICQRFRAVVDHVTSPPSAAKGCGSGSSIRPRPYSRPRAACGSP